MVRIKERYLLVNIIYPLQEVKDGDSTVANLLVQHQPTIEHLTAGLLAKAIKEKVAILFGDSGAGAMEGALSVKYLSLATSTIILRCHRAHYQLLWAALTFMDHVPVPNGRPCLFRVVRVSGTIRKAEEEAIRQARKLILHAKEQQEQGKNTSGFLSMAREGDSAMTDVMDTMSDDDMDTDDG